MHSCFYSFINSFHSYHHYYHIALIVPFSDSFSWITYPGIYSHTLHDPTWCLGACVGLYRLLKSPLEKLWMIHSLFYHDQWRTSDYELQKWQQQLCLSSASGSVWWKIRDMNSPALFFCGFQCVLMCDWKCVFLLVGWWDRRGNKTQGRELILCGFYSPIWVCGLGAAHTHFLSV